jgi:hypothetical protein
MSRDFFNYLRSQDSNQTTWYAIGSGQSVTNPDNFRYKATVAYNKAVDAIKQESDGYTWSSKQTWRQIYGTRYPD